MLEQANSEVVNAVIQILEENRLYVKEADLVAVVSAMTHWLQNKKRGLEFMSYLMSLDSVRGRNDKIYKLRDGFGITKKEVKAEDLIFLRGCILRNEPLPVSLIEIEDREDEFCESCGGQVTCLTTVKGTFNERLESLCTFCVKQSEEYSMSYTPEVDCEKCSFGACQWHPTNKDVPLLDYNI